MVSQRGVETLAAPPRTPVHPVLPNAEEPASPRAQCPSMLSTAPAVAADAGVALLQGNKSYMEDRASAWQLGSDWLCAGVYDGHVGDKAAAFCAAEMHRAVAKALSEAGNERAEEALAAAFAATDEALAAAHPDDSSGTTACVLLRRRLPDGSCHIIFASAGDSRAVLHDAATMTREFKPDDEDEAMRIEAAGGSIFDMEDGCGGRVVAPDNVSMLQTSRSIGDRAFKATEPPLVPATPETRSSIIGAVDATQSPEGGFAILASDGVWDVLSNNKACAIVRDVLTRTGRQSTALSAAAAALCDAALAADSEDNMCACVVAL